MTTQTPDAVPVIQADRDAAFSYWLYRGSLKPDDYRAVKWRRELNQGDYDGKEIVQAFARHRLAAHDNLAGDTIEFIARVLWADAQRRLGSVRTDLPRTRTDFREIAVKLLDHPALDSRAGDAGEGLAITPRRPWDDDYPDGYLESDRDFVLNNIDACVAWLERATPAPAVGAWTLVERLRDQEADSVTILCDNPDGPPNNAVECSGFWTGFVERRFDGDTIIAALRSAVAAKDQADRDGHPPISPAVDAVPAGEVIERLDAYLAAEQIDESTSPQNGEDFPSWSSGYLTAIDLTRQRLASLSHGGGRK